MKRSKIQKIKIYKKILKKNGNPKFFYHICIVISMDKLTMKKKPKPKPAKPKPKPEKTETETETETETKTKTENRRFETGHYSGFPV